MKSKNKPLFTNNVADIKQRKPILLDEVAALPEKFFTFTHEGISMIWLHGTPSLPMQANHSRQT